MRFTRAFEDLRFVIGLFLGLIGIFVLVQFAVRPSELTEGISVNLLGGTLLVVTGAFLAGSVLLGKDSK
jgi:hypothetical protein